MKTELAKLAYLRGLDAHTLDLSALPAQRRRFLAGVGRRLTAQALSRRETERRYPILPALLAESVVVYWMKWCCCSTKRYRGANPLPRPA